MYFTIGKTIYFINLETRKATKCYTAKSKGEAEEMVELHQRLYERTIRERARMTPEERQEEEDFQRDMTELMLSIRV